MIENRRQVPFSLQQNGFTDNVSDIVSQMIVDEKRYSDIPVWRRYPLTIEEAAAARESCECSLTHIPMKISI